MPTYEYRPTDDQEGCPGCSPGLDVLQGMSEAPLTECPHCGVSIARVITGCRVNTRPSDKTMLSDANLKKHGFQKLVRGENGYEPTL